MLSVVTDESTRERTLPSALDEIVREGARRMLAAALEAEVDGYIEAHVDERDGRGKRLVVRNGRAERRTITTGAGPVEIEAPRVNDKRVDDETGARARFRSSIVAPWCRKSPKVVEVLPLMCLHGMSTGDFVPALEEFFGSAAGLSSSVITRLTKQWQAERDAFMRRDLSGVDYVYVWVDGIHFNIRLEEERLCTLVIVGVRADGTKELVAISDGYRESTDSWADLLRDLPSRGMRAPVLAIGDGALGFWAALRDVFPQTKTQRCWVHKAANVLAALPTSAHPTARRMLAEIRDAEDRDHAVRAAHAFAHRFGGKWPKAVAKIADDLDALLAFYDFPAEHWIHLKTTNPIESTFSTVRLRTRVTKGAGSRAAGLAMAFKLIESAEQRWRAVNGPHLVALVRAGATFEKGVLIEGPNQHDQEDAA
ncbi:MAG TPA: IS256 family transposase [Acidimicrobiales bacterium]|nr:IS256 family transposase [Acidimicrobiales bacterium]